MPVARPLPAPRVSGACWAEVGGQRFWARSAWERRYALYLQWLLDRGEIERWEHEPETFWFEKIRRGVRSYLPDFRVTERGGRIVYHEVKGYFDARSRTALKRMRIYYPKIAVLLIDKKTYRAIERTMKPLIPGWAA